ncbi:MAG: hypothetical protein N2Z23_10475 [Pyrinomonadaceae bacterium]|nr:hypothetical protein [Pyrinomonadaceae bacterium]MCX7640850.1 hypothetical protein [Pyrinomonadaceae bacterium]MDW8303385.1 hypothetical protein [Acidobacteriota bacterium]
MNTVKHTKCSGVVSRKRDRKIGKWNKILSKEDVNGIWSELYRIVSSHPLVRASKTAGLLDDKASKQDIYVELTQELFFILLSKDRFQHYLDNRMSDEEIEKEIAQIELTNLLTTELRKRYPESYRLARRISTIIQTSKSFKRFDNSDGQEESRKLADRIYGLAEWPDDKKRRSYQEAEVRVKTVPFHKRNIRNVGCTGDAQIVISNGELEELIIRVLKAVDSPMDIRSLRSLVLSRLPVIDIYLVPISNGDESEEEKPSIELVDIRETPEESILRKEAEQIAADSVDEFLKRLHQAVNGKTKQFNRMMKILWHCYLSPNGGTQLQIAEMLKVSDSLVSDYRRRIEESLRSLSFSDVNEARHFEQELRKKVKDLILEAQ